MRAVRKVTTYICTECFHAFPSKAVANRHVADVHKGGGRPDAPTRRKRRGVPQVQKIANAIAGGASSAKEIERRTRIPLTRVHSLLTYLRKRGRITGYGDELALA